MLALTVPAGRVLALAAIPEAGAAGAAVGLWVAFFGPLRVCESRTRALRFTPEGAQLPGAQAAAQQRSPLSALMPPMPRRSAAQQGATRRFARVWIIEEGEPALVLFRAGASDGRMTQVLEGPAPDPGRMGSLANDERFRAALARKLEPGTKVIVAEEAAKR